MKLHGKVLSLAVAVPFAQGNLDGCAPSFEAGKDYFPDKVEATESQYWSVTYEDSYKIARNSFENKTYLLYQCGTEPPADLMDQHDFTIAVPIGNFGLTQTTMIPFIELLGKRTSIAAIVGTSLGSVYSPCLNEMADQNKVGNVGFFQKSNTTAIEEAGIDLDLDLFVQGGNSLFSSQIYVSAFAEDFNLATFEWIKYYSLFLNLESEANEAFKDTKGRYECAVENAALLSTDTEEKPTVLWGSYSAYCGGWSVARKCPEYYCEFAEACGATLLTSQEGSIDATETCGLFYMSTEEFVEYGKDADHWIYTSPGVDSMVYSRFKDELQNFKSVLNSEVYDTEGAGQNSWFEQRLAEPGKFFRWYIWSTDRMIWSDFFSSIDAILQDFCFIVGNENLASPVPHTLTYLRQVDDAIPSPPLCNDQSAPLQTLGSQCVLIPGETATDPPTDAPDPEDAAASSPQLLLGLLMSVAVAFI